MRHCESKERLGEVRVLHPGVTSLAVLLDVAEFIFDRLIKNPVFLSDDIVRVFSKNTASAIRCFYCCLMSFVPYLTSALRYTNVCLSILSQKLAWVIKGPFFGLREPWPICCVDSLNL